MDQLLQIFRILGTPDNDQLTLLNRNGNLNCPFPSVQPITINKVFQGKGKELTALLNKIFLYESHKRLNALEIMAHPFFDELRSSESVMAGKYIVPQLFDFSETEISLYSSQRNLLKRIIPEWAECYKQI